jgi:hypothetical protein
MRHVFAGAVLVVAGIAAFIEAHSHHPNTNARVVAGGRRLNATSDRESR